MLLLLFLTSGVWAFDKSKYARFDHGYHEVKDGARYISEDKESFANITTLTECILKSEQNVWKTINYNSDLHVCEVVTSEGEVKEERNWKMITSASLSTDKWHLVQSIVCFHGKRNGFGVITIRKAGRLKALRITRLYGAIKCWSRAGLSPYGCSSSTSRDKIGVYITKKSTKEVIFPLNPPSERGLYKLAGHSVNSQKVVWTSPNGVSVRGGTKFRLWYYSSLKNKDMANKVGSTCSKVYAKYYLH